MFVKRPSKATQFAKLGVVALVVGLCGLLAADIAGYRIVPYASSSLGSSVSPCPTEQNPSQVFSSPDIPTLPTVPAYPNAEDLQVMNIPKSTDNPAGTPYLGGAFTTKITKFKTHDKPQIVQQFYDEALQKGGWELDALTQAPNELQFSWSPLTQEAKIWEGKPCPPTPSCCEPIYLLRLILTQTSMGTNVELREGYWPGV